MKMKYKNKEKVVEKIKKENNISNFEIYHQFELEQLKMYKLFKDMYGLDLKNKL